MFTFHPKTPNKACPGEIARDFAPDPWESTKDRLVGLPQCGVRVFRPFAWLEVGSCSLAESASRPSATARRASPRPHKERGAGRKPLGGAMSIEKDFIEGTTKGCTQHVET